MGCDNANEKKCSNCYKGSAKAQSWERSKTGLDKSAPKVYNTRKEGNKRQKGYQNAKAHKAFHIRRMTGG